MTHIEIAILMLIRDQPTQDLEYALLDAYQVADKLKEDGLLEEDKYYALTDKGNKVIDALIYEYTMQLSKLNEPS